MRAVMLNTSAFAGSDQACPALPGQPIMLLTSGHGFDDGKPEWLFISFDVTHRTHSKSVCQS
jgi:hypothetical protein